MYRVINELSRKNVRSWSCRTNCMAVQTRPPITEQTVFPIDSAFSRPIRGQIRWVWSSWCVNLSNIHRSLPRPCRFPIVCEECLTDQEKQGERRLVEYKRSHFADFENQLRDVQWIINEANKRGHFSTQYFLPSVKIGNLRAAAPPHLLSKMIVEQLHRHHYKAWVHPSRPTCITISWRPERDDNPFKKDDTVTEPRLPQLNISDRPEQTSPAVTQIFTEPTETEATVAVV